MRSVYRLHLKKKKKWARGPVSNPRPWVQQRNAYAEIASINETAGANHAKRSGKEVGDFNEVLSFSSCRLRLFNSHCCYLVNFVTFGVLPVNILSGEHESQMFLIATFRVIAPTLSVTVWVPRPPYSATVQRCQRFGLRSPWQRNVREHAQSGARTGQKSARNRECCRNGARGDTRRRGSRRGESHRQTQRQTELRDQEEGRQRKDERQAAVTR